MLLTTDFSVNCCHKLILENEIFEVTEKINSSKTICQKTVRQTALENQKIVPF